MADAERTDNELAAALGLPSPEGSGEASSDSSSTSSSEPEGAVEVALEQMHTAAGKGDWKRAARALRAAIREVGEEG